MTKKLRIGLFTYSISNDCSMLQRVGYPLMILKNMGLIEFSVLYMSALSIYAMKSGAPEEIAQFDILIFQRAIAETPFLIDLIDKVQKANPDIVIIFEYDDFFYKEYGLTNNIMTSNLHSNFCLITSTSYLANQLKLCSPFSKVYAYPTRLPLIDNVEVARPDSNIILHTGTNTHKNDLNSVNMVLYDILNKYPEKTLVLWGNEIPKVLNKIPNRIKLMDFIPDYNNFLDKFISQVHGSFLIHPLTISRFNMCKTAIKYLETANKRIPGLFPDIPSYNEAVKVKELIVKDGDWNNKIEWMLNLTQKQRDEIAISMYEDVLENWTHTEETAIEYFDILKDCAYIQKGIVYEA
jgi:hypothetical protein